MTGQARQDMMAILPNGFAHHDRRLRWDVSEDAISMFLAADETMALLGIVGVGSYHLMALASDRVHHGLLDFALRLPALLVRGETEVAVC